MDQSSTQSRSSLVDMMDTIKNLLGQIDDAQPKQSTKGSQATKATSRDEAPLNLSKAASSGTPKLRAEGDYK